MYYTRSATTLLPTHSELLEKDLLSMIELCNFSSFTAFKSSWAENHFSMIHHCIHPKEDLSEFYQTIFGLLTSFMHLSTEMAFKSIHILYAIYFTQINRKVLIPITPETVSILIKLTSTFEDCRNMVAKLSQFKAFQIGVCEGVKSVIKVKRGQSEKIEEKEDTETLEKVENEIDIDVEEVHKQAVDYLVKKEVVKEIIRENIELFEKEELPDNRIAQYFKPGNLEMLNLASPSFVLSILSRLNTIENINNKFNNNNFD
jgi:hypothetical protein